VLSYSQDSTIYMAAISEGVKALRAAVARSSP
jgi:hypothetical protein